MVIFKFCQIFKRVGRKTMLKNAPLHGDNRTQAWITRRFMFWLLHRFVASLTVPIVYALSYQQVGKPLAPFHFHEFLQLKLGKIGFVMDFHAYYLRLTSYITLSFC